MNDNAKKGRQEWKVTSSNFNGGRAERFFESKEAAVSFAEDLRAGGGVFHVDVWSCTANTWRHFKEVR